MLARTDYVILAVCLGLYLLASLPRKSGGRVVFVAAAASTAVVAPWLFWNKMHFGSLMQVSGVAVPYAVHQRHLIAHGLVEWRGS